MVKDDLESLRDFFKDGEAPGHADVLVNEPLGWTYRQIARVGSDALYKDGIARRIVERWNGPGQPVPMDAVAFQRSDWAEPISTT